MFKRLFSLMLFIPFMALAAPPQYKLPPPDAEGFLKLDLMLGSENPEMIERSQMILLSDGQKSIDILNKCVDPQKPAQYFSCFLIAHSMSPNLIVEERADLHLSAFSSMVDIIKDPSDGIGHITYALIDMDDLNPANPSLSSVHKLRGPANETRDWMTMRLIESGVHTRYRTACKMITMRQTNNGRPLQVFGRPIGAGVAAFDQCMAIVYGQISAVTFDLMEKHPRSATVLEPLAKSSYREYELRSGKAGLPMGR